MNLEPLSLDQMRVFTLVAEEGSFSAAARRLGRAQSAISYAIATLEQQLGCGLFDRSGHTPRLTQDGAALLADIRAILGKADAVLAKARSLTRGLEPELSLVVDMMFPTDRLVMLLREFEALFPTVTLRLHTEALGAVTERVLQGRSELGILVSAFDIPPGTQGYALDPVEIVPVVAPTHPLAALEGPIARDRLQDHLQLVITDRSELTKGKDFTVFSPHTWRLSEMGTKRALLLAGIGWGTMPIQLVAEDLAAGRLVRLRLQALSATGSEQLPMHIVHRSDRPPGPAGRWVISQVSPSAPSHFSMDFAQISPIGTGDQRR